MNNIENELLKSGFFLVSEYPIIYHKHYENYYFECNLNDYPNAKLVIILGDYLNNVVTVHKSISFNEADLNIGLFTVDSLCEELKTMAKVNNMLRNRIRKNSKIADLQGRTVLVNTIEDLGDNNFLINGKNPSNFQSVILLENDLLNTFGFIKKENINIYGLPNQTVYEKELIIGGTDRFLIHFIKDTNDNDRLKLLYKNNGLFGCGFMILYFHELQDFIFKKTGEMIL